MGRSWRWGGGRRRVARLGSSLSRLQQSTDWSLSMARKALHISEWPLQREEEESVSAKNWPHLCFRKPTGFSHSAGLCKKDSRFYSRCVELCRVFS